MDPLLESYFVSRGLGGGGGLRFRPRTSIPLSLAPHPTRDNCAKHTVAAIPELQVPLTEMNAVVTSLLASSKRGNVLERMKQDHNAQVQLQIAEMLAAGGEGAFEGADKLRDSLIGRKLNLPNEVRWLGLHNTLTSVLEWMPVLLSLSLTPGLITFRETKKNPDGTPAQKKGPLFFERLRRLVAAPNVNLLATVERDLIGPIARTAGVIQGRDWFALPYLQRVDALVYEMMDLKAKGNGTALDGGAVPKPTSFADKLVCRAASQFVDEINARYTGKLPEHVTNACLFSPEFVVNNLGMDGDSDDLTAGKKWLRIHALARMVATQEYKTPHIDSRVMNMPISTDAERSAKNDALTKATNVGRQYLRDDLAADLTRELRTWTQYSQDLVNEAVLVGANEKAKLEAERDKQQEGTIGRYNASKECAAFTRALVDGLHAWRQLKLAQERPATPAVEAKDGVPAVPAYTPPIKTPLLHELCGHWLCAQISAAEIERVFSLCGHVLGPRRNKLGSAKVNDWLRACYQLRQTLTDARFDGVRGPGVRNPHADVASVLAAAVGPPGGERCTFEEAE